MLKEIFNRLSLLFKPGIDISYSRINAYQSCPYKYKIIYIDGRKVQPNQFISLGISIHRTLEKFHSKRSPGFEDLIDAYNSSWANEGFSSPQQAYEFFEKGRRMLEAYYKENLDLKAEVLFVEKDFGFNLGKNRMRGLIDRIDRHPDGAYEVIDYKTHNEVWKQEKADSDLQMSLYAFACERALGFKPNILTYYFLAHGKKVTTTRSNEQIKSAVKTALSAAEKIVRGIFTPDKTFCPKCDFKKTCPHSSHPLPEGRGKR